MAKARSHQRVCIISTDPAHNTSDAFNQQFGPNPQQVNCIDGVTNLYCMEIKPSDDSANNLQSLFSLNDTSSVMEGVTEEVNDMRQSFF